MSPPFLFPAVWDADMMAGLRQQTRILTRKWGTKSCETSERKNTFKIESSQVPASCSHLTDPGKLHSILPSFGKEWSCNLFKLLSLYVSITSAELNLN